MKKLIVSAILCIVFAGVHAQKDVKASSILDKVSANYNTFNSLSADFTITIESLVDETSNDQKGSIQVKGDKYLLKMDGQEIISNGKDVWTYLKDINEVQINVATEDEESISPINFFTLYENGFKYIFVGESIRNSKNCYQIDLVPEKDNRSFYKVQLFVEKSSSLITGAKILDKGGTHFIYNIDKFKGNIDTPDSMFEFKPDNFPGIEIIDLR